MNIEYFLSISEILFIILCTYLECIQHAIA